MKKRKKKWLLPLFSLCLAIAAILTMPGTKVYAATEWYEIYVAGVPVNSDNAGNILAGTENDGKVWYDPDTNTLTLDGANIAFSSTTWYCPLDIRQDLTIRLLNQNVIRESSATKRSDTTYTVHSTGNLTFCGDGSLEIKGVNACSKDLYALWCNGDFTLQSGTLTATVGECTSTSSKNMRNNQAIVASGNIYITGGELNAVSGKASVQGLSSAIFTTHDIEISNAKVSAVSGTGLNSYAMNANENLTIRNSEVSSAGGEAGNYSTGIRCESEANGSVIGTLTISDSTITAASGNAGLRGIALESNELQADNSHITAKGGNSVGSVDGIHTNDKASLRSCEVNTEAGDGGGNSLGWWCSELEADDSHITAKGGTAATASYGISAAGFTLHGGSVRAEAGAASEWSIGLWTNGANISAGTLVAIAGQAGGTNAITSSPVFADNYKVTVKAGTDEEGAVVIESPTDETYRSNTYVSIEPYVHVHGWAETWTSDDTHHWHVCVAGDCDITEYTQMDAYAEHTYGDEYDAYCDVCGANRTVPDRPEAPSYQIIDGAGGEWIMKEDESLSICGDGDFDKFVEVRVDGKALAAEHYDVQSGSTIVTLKAAYLNTLAAGSHNIEIVWTDGSAGTTFTVIENTSGDTGNEGTGDGNTGNTGNEGPGDGNTDNIGNGGTGNGNTNNAGNGGNDGNESGDAGDGDTEDGGSDVGYMADMETQIMSAAKGATVKFTGINTLPNSVMKTLLERKDVTLIMEYTYGGKVYTITIPAGAALDNDIPWYGPLYLSAHYGSGAVTANGFVYVVKPGDTMSKIARANRMTLSQLAAKNPQIKNINSIRVGQKINL